MAMELRLKSELLEGAQPFGIDFGGSALKLVYLCKDPEDEKYTLIKCRAFPAADIQKAFDFIKSEVDIPRRPGGELPELVMTGVGMYEYAKTMEQQLKFRPLSIWESHCNSKAALFLMKTMTADELYHPPLYEARDEAWKLYAAQYAAFMTACGNTPPDPSNIQHHQPQPWPLMLVALGSAFTFRLVDEKGDTKDVNFSPRGGRSFLGLGSLLTGAKSFDELIALAKAGDDHLVNTYTSDLTKKFESKDGDDTAYSKLAMDVNVYSYGWAVGKTTSDYKREDLARAVLYSHVQELVLNMMQVCAWKKVTNVVMVGGFVNDPLVRELVEKEVYHTQGVTTFTEPGSAAEHATVRMLVAGTYLGAIGALLQPLASPE